MTRVKTIYDITRRRGVKPSKYKRRLRYLLRKKIKQYVARFVVGHKYAYNPNKKYTIPIIFRRPIYANYPTQHDTTTQPPTRPAPGP